MWIPVGLYPEATAHCQSMNMQLLHKLRSLLDRTSWLKENHGLRTRLKTASQPTAMLNNSRMLQARTNAQSATSIYAIRHI